MSVIEAAQSAGINARTASEGLAWFRAEGPVGLMDRSNRPLRTPGRTETGVVEKVIDLRRSLLPAMEVAHAIKHSFTRPHRPQTNGMAERFIKTALRERAYRLAYTSSEQRNQALKVWRHHYNHLIPHSALAGLTPAATLNNVLGRDT